MSRETYKGRELKVVKAPQRRRSRRLHQQPADATRYGVPEREVIEQFHRDINHVDHGTCQPD